MNERIKELAIQAAGEDFQTFGCGMLISQVKIELFAELIVRECAKVAEEYDCNLSGNGGEILEHFGVEE